MDSEGLKMRIENTKDVHISNINCLIYGASGSGKTYLARTLVEPTLLISAESGLISLSGTNIDFVDISKDEETGETIGWTKRIEYLFSIYDQLKSPELRAKYKNIYIDSLTEIGKIFVKHYQEQYPDSKDSFKLWGDYHKAMENFILKFRDIVHYNVFFTCYEEKKQDDSKAWSYAPSIPATQLKETLPFFFTEVFRLVKEDRGTRFLVCDGTKATEAKDRSGKLELTEEVNLQKILNKIREE